MVDDRPSPDHVASNWRSSDLPLGSKLVVLVRNQAIKIGKGSYCCGNHGEPGC